MRSNIIKYLPHKSPQHASSFLLTSCLPFLDLKRENKTSNSSPKCLDSWFSHRSTYLLSYFLSSMLSGTKHIDWSKIVWEEVTVDQDVPLRGDIYSFTEVSPTLNALRLLGSKSEYKVQSQAKGILPTSVVWCWHSVAVLCLSGRWRRWRHQTEDQWLPQWWRALQAQRGPGASTADIVAADTWLQSYTRSPCTLPETTEGKRGQEQTVFVVLVLPSAHLILAQPWWAALRVMPDSNSNSYQGISSFSAQRFSPKPRNTTEPACIYSSREREN